MKPVNTVSNCSKGSVLRVKGRVSSRTLDMEDGKEFNFPDIIVEKVMFISTKKDE